MDRSLIFADVKTEILEIKKMVIELFKRPMVGEPIVETVIPTVEVPNILAMPVDE